eukprot:m.168509 g.168509  ORF g.168509 m.168509 type:complete len:69 (-) comp16651_c0_seq16:3166-3372(-)
MASSAVKLADLNDFINPSQVCIKPVELSKGEDDGSKPARIEIEPDGSYIQVSPVSRPCYPHFTASYVK